MAKILLEHIKKEDFSDWDVSFWLIKRKLVNKENQYSALTVEIDGKLTNKFKSYLKKQLQEKAYHIETYDYSNADGEDVLFTMDMDTTDFKKVIDEINKGFDNARVEKYDDLLNSWGYVILFEKNEKKLFSWKQISADTQAKKVKAKDKVFFKNHKLIDVDENQVFVIYPYFDFFAFEEKVIIAHKRQFENSMNFRDGMIAKSKDLLTEFTQLGTFQNIELIEKFIGNNLHHLRKMASIFKSGYYKQPDYIKSLIAVNSTEEWNLKIENDQIVIEEETIGLLLVLLNNDRLRSIINDETFDASAKSIVKK